MKNIKNINNEIIITINNNKYLNIKYKHNNNIKQTKTLKNKHSK